MNSARRTVPTVYKLSGERQNTEKCKRKQADVTIVTNIHKYFQLSILTANLYMLNL